MLSPSPVAYGVREAIHDGGGWAERTHDVLETSVNVGGAPAEFLSVLIPEVATADGYDAAAVTSCGDTCRSWTRGGLSCRAWLDAPQSVASPSGTTLVTSDSGAMCSDGTATYGSFVGLDGDPAAAITARFGFDADGAVSGWRVRIHAFDPTAARAAVTVPAVAGAEPAGACGWSDASGRWRLDAVGDVHTAAHAPSVVARVAIAGHGGRDPSAVPVSEPVTLDATSGCASDTAPYTWSIVEQPELSTLELPPTDGPMLLFVPDLPGVWRIRVTVSDAAGTDSAVLAFEAEGEPFPVLVDTDTDADGDTDAVPRRCGCDHGGGAWLGGWALALVVVRRRDRVVPSATRRD